jgi:hypothetical protein
MQEKLWKRAISLPEKSAIDKFAPIAISNRATPYLKGYRTLNLYFR